MVISREAKDYRKQVSMIVKTCVSPKSRPITKSISLGIVANPPDRRRRDLDNLLKATLDAMEIAGLYRNDRQVHQLAIEWGQVRKIPSLEIAVNLIEDMLR
jgi:crossover junction endodeoxyribonuclease RusA